MLSSDWLEKIPVMKEPIKSFCFHHKTWCGGGVGGLAINPYVVDVVAGEITLIAVGPLTNVGMAMRMDETFASNLKELYIMGGNTEGI